MKTKIVLFFLFVTTTLLAQKPCEFTTDVNDSIGTYKSTKEYLVYEKNFGGKASYIFNSLAITDGVPSLNVQFIEKSYDFIKAKCFDKTSRLYIQLNNGKIVTLLHAEQDNCGNMIRDDKGMNNRILTGYFLFRIDDFQALKESGISYIRIKFSTDTEDYIMKKEFTAELDSQIYKPESYFLDYFHCIEEN